jgi:hypothetical protein
MSLRSCGLLAPIFAVDARASRPMTVVFALLRNTGAAEKSETFRIMRHIELVHAPRQPLSRLG